MTVWYDPFSQTQTLLSLWKWDPWQMKIALPGFGSLLQLLLGCSLNFLFIKYKTGSKKLISGELGEFSLCSLCFWSLSICNIKLLAYIGVFSLQSCHICVEIMAFSSSPASLWTSPLSSLIFVDLSPHSSERRSQLKLSHIQVFITGRDRNLSLI